MNRLLKEFDLEDKRLIESLSDAELKLLRHYKKALDEIKGLISDLYGKYEFPSMTDVRKFDRLTKLEKEMASVIKKLTKVSINTTSGEIREAFKTSYYGTGEAIGKGLELNIVFSKLPTEAINYAVQDNIWLDLLKNHNAKLMTETKQIFETTLRTNAREEVVSGLAQGKSYKQVSKAIEDRFNVAATRARTISRTEMHKSHSKGRLEGIKRAEASAKRLGVELKRMWKHNHAGKDYRPAHVAMDGQYADPEGFFMVNGIKMEAPGIESEEFAGMAPQEIINCHCSVVAQVEGLE